MGLDMMIFRTPRIGNYEYRDFIAAEYWFDLQAYKKKHPEYKKGMDDWCGMKKPSQSLLNKMKGQEDFVHEVAYWRKANAIHKWFVDNVQDGEDDCQAHRELTKQDLETLRDLCVKVKDDPDMAKELLPRQEGFFFGDTNYDDWYFEDIDNTIGQLEELLADHDFANYRLYYVSSW